MEFLTILGKSDFATESFLRYDKSKKRGEDTCQKLHKFRIHFYIIMPC